MFEQIQNAVSAIDTFNQSQPYIDVVIVALVVLSSELAKKYKPDNVKIANKWLSLFTGFIVISIYLIALDRAEQLFNANLPKYVISFLLANATYSYIWKYVKNWFKTAGRKNQIHNN